MQNIDTNPDSLTIIIPAFNEARNLEIILPALTVHCREKNWQVLVVNDGSGDNSGEVLGKFESAGDLKVINHKLNKGYGAAIKSGFAGCSTDYAITFDADGQHSVEDIDTLFRYMVAEDADLVVGSRNGFKSSSLIKGLGKGIIRTIARILMTVPIHDLNSGMKIYRADLAKKYLNLAPDTMAFSDIITLVFISNRHLVLEVPIQVRERLKGTSSIRIQTAFQTIMEIIHVIILFNPMKIFLPLSFLSLLAGLAIGIPLIIRGHGFSTGSMLGIISGINLFLLGLIAEQLSSIRRNNSH
jgi:glycosyltransferase involved in cell wall biosynthesis